MNNPIAIEEGSPDIGKLLESKLLKSLGTCLPQSTNTCFVLVAKGLDDSIIGGLTGSTSYGWLLVKVLWIDVEYRNAGLGRLLMSCGETKARAFGCHSTWLDTSNPDAMRFYLKLGYETFAEIANSPEQPLPQHRRWFMKKMLA